MIALLGNIKGYLEAAAGVLLVVVALWFVHHERTIGAQKVVAKDAVAVAAQVTHNTEVENSAQTLVQQAVSEYNSQVAAAPVAPVRVVVCSPTLDTGAVPDDAGAKPIAPRATGVPSNVGQGRDIGPETDKLLDDADAEVRALQSYVKTCQMAGICKR